MGNECTFWQRMHVLANSAPVRMEFYGLFPLYISISVAGANIVNIRGRLSLFLSLVLAKIKEQFF